MAHIKRVIIIKLGIPACILFLLFMVIFAGESSGASDGVLVVTNG